MQVLYEIDEKLTIKKQMPYFSPEKKNKKQVHFLPDA